MEPTNGRRQIKHFDNKPSKYLHLVDRRLAILVSGINWKPEYETELNHIDKEIYKLKILLDAEHKRRGQIRMNAD